MTHRVNMTLRVRYLPLELLEDPRIPGAQQIRKVAAPCFYCRGEGEDPGAEPWKKTEECPACRGEAEQEAMIMAAGMTLYIFLSRWLWELATGERSLDPEEDQPWSGDPNAWKGDD